MSLLREISQLRSIVVYSRRVILNITYIQASALSEPWAGVDFEEGFNQTTLGVHECRNVN